MTTFRAYTTLSELAKNVLWLTGQELTGINFTHKKTKWTMVIKVRTDKGTNLVSFVDADSIEDCLQFLDAALHTTAVHLKWYPDKFST